MLKHTIQWYRNVWIKEVKKLPTIKEEAGLYKSFKRGRHPIPDPHHYGVICFICNKFFDNNKPHLHSDREHARWDKSMGYYHIKRKGRY